MRLSLGSGGLEGGVWVMLVGIGGGTVLCFGVGWFPGVWSGGRSESVMLVGRMGEGRGDPAGRRLNGTPVFGFALRTFFLFALPVAPLFRLGEVLSMGREVGLYAFLLLRVTTIVVLGLLFQCFYRLG